MLAWGLALSIYKCNLLGEKLYVPFFLCLLWPTLCACVCAKNDFTVCEPYVFSFFFLLFTWSCGEESHSCAVFFFFEELFCTSFLFFLSPFYTKKKKEAKIQIRKTTSTSGVEGKEKRHIQTRCFFFFF